jgi:hypothetical protein
MILRIQEFQDIGLKNHFHTKIKFSNHWWTSKLFICLFLRFNLINYFTLFHHVGSKVQILKDHDLMILNFDQAAFVLLLLIRLLHQFNHGQVFIHIF